MKEGLYHVKFSSGPQNFGQGIVVIRGGTANGGDDGYVYTGPLIGSDDDMSATLHVKRWNPTHESVFGPVAAFDLTLKGKANGSTGAFSMSGSVVGQPTMRIGINGTYLAPAI